MLENPNILVQFNTSILSSCVFIKVEAAGDIVSAPSIDAYNVFFSCCNTISRAFSITSTYQLSLMIACFEKSGGVTTPREAAASNATIQSVMTSDTCSNYCIELSCSGNEMFHINLTKNFCKIPFCPDYSPSYLISRFVTLISNRCNVCANLESNFSTVNQNSLFQIIKNNCSECLLQVYQSDCYCDWFYFIDNNVTNYRHRNNLCLYFTNFYSSSSLDVLIGSTSGVLSLNSSLPNHLPFPIVMKPKTRIRRFGQTSIRIVILLNVFLMYLMLLVWY